MDPQTVVHPYVPGGVSIMSYLNQAVTIQPLDTAVLRDAIRSLAELGDRHNRWRVRDIVTTILQSIRETEPSLAATEALRAASQDAVEWTLTEFSVRSLPPVLRAGIHDLLQTLPQ